MLRNMTKIPEHTLLPCFLTFLGKILAGNFGKLKCKIGKFPAVNPSPIPKYGAARGYTIFKQTSVCHVPKHI